MAGAFEWISKIAEWLGAFIPQWAVIDTTMGAVKFVRGSKVKPLGPGIHFWWPVTTNFYRYPVARQGEDLRSQTLVTTDDKVIIVGGMIIYEVVDIEPLLAHTYKPSETIRDIALTAIHDVCCKLSWPELKEAQRKGTLDTKLKNAAKEALEPYGVKVLKTMLTDLAPARVIKVLQSTSKDAE